MDLHELRRKIDEIDDELIKLFQQRMELSAEIAMYKIEHEMPVYDPERERQKLNDLSYKVHERYKVDVITFFSSLFELSRNEQERIINSEVDFGEGVDR